MIEDKQVQILIALCYNINVANLREIG